MFAFLTGSRVYGRVTKKSDVDLVIRVDYDTAQKLRYLADRLIVEVRKKGERKPCRFGRLNLILCETDVEMAV